MPNLWGKRLSKAALLKHVGDVAQVGGLRRLEHCDGVERGVEVIELRTGAGLELDILPTRGLDFGAVRFNGQPLSWLSAAGFAHPGLVETSPQEGWLRAFGGGLMTTCGLSNVGSPNEDESVQHRQHGRASFAPAFEVGAWGEWVGDDYQMMVRGKTREAVLYGDKIERTRTIRARLGEASIELEDTLHNIGSKPAALMVLYHFNLGWPLIGPDSRLKVPSVKHRVVIGKGTHWKVMPAPDADFSVGVIEHRMRADAGGWVRLEVASPTLRFKLAYEKTLGRFTQWQQFGVGDYVLGLEPGNVGVLGRAAERAAGTLPILEPGESRVFRLELSVSAVRQ
jgi:hypothetical protein